MSGVSIISLLSLLFVLVYLLTTRARFKKMNDDAKRQGKPGFDMWEHLSSKPRQPGLPAVDTRMVNAQGIFNTGEFLEGAKVIRSLIQDALGKRGFDDVEEYLAPEALADLRNFSMQKHLPGSASIVLIRAVLQSLRHENGADRAEVEFDITMHIHSTSSPVDIKERWNFVRRPDEDWRIEEFRHLEGGKAW